MDVIERFVVLSSKASMEEIAVYCVNHLMTSYGISGGVQLNCNMDLSEYKLLINKKYFGYTITSISECIVGEYIFNILFEFLSYADYSYDISIVSRLRIICSIAPILDAEEIRSVISSLSEKLEFFLQNKHDINLDAFLIFGFNEYRDIIFNEIERIL